MTNENNGLPNDVETLQAMVKDLQQRCHKLTDEAEHKNVTQQQQTAELARLYEQLTGSPSSHNWTVRDYALSIYQYLDNIIALAPGNLFWMDRNSVLRGVNNTLAKLGGFSRHAMVGKSNAELPWKDQAEMLEVANKRVMETGKSVVVEEMVETTLGIRTYLSEKVPLRNDDGDIVGVLGTAMDITEQKQAIESLRSAKQKVEGASQARSEFLRRTLSELRPFFAEIAKHINELLQQAAADENKRNSLTVILHKNEQILKIFNSVVDYDKALLDSKSIFDVSEWNPSENIIESLRLHDTVANSDEIIYKLEEKCKNLQQSIDRLLKENKQLRAVHQRETSEFAALYQKVTGQIPQTRLSLRDYALAVYEYLDSIISFAPGHLFWLDKNNIYLGCNEEHAKNVGLISRDFIVGKTNADLPWSEQAFALDNANMQVMESGKPLVIEELVETVKGFRTYLSAKVPLKNQEDEIIGLLGTAFDISEQKEALAVMEVARKKAEEASWAKSEFIQNMSHDLKTPLMTIMGMTEFLAETENQEERKEHLRMINRAGNRMLEVFTSILDVASLEAGQIEIKKEPINLHEILQGLVELYQPLVEQKCLYFHVEIEEEVPTFIISDPMRLQRILLNLIGNALKFTKDGGVTIKAGLQKNNEQKHLILSVLDTGVGIPLDKLDVIFEKFVRLTSSYEGKYTGTGLGLGIVKRFVEELQGTIKVESEEGKGTAFIFKLIIS